MSIVKRARGGGGRGICSILDGDHSCDCTRVRMDRRREITAERVERRDKT